MINAGDWQWLAAFFELCCAGRVKVEKAPTPPHQPVHVEVRRVNSVPLCEDVLRKHSLGDDDWENFNIGYEEDDEGNEYMVIVCKDDKGNNVILTLPRKE